MYHVIDRVNILLYIIINNKVFLILAGLALSIPGLDDLITLVSALASSALALP